MSANPPSSTTTATCRMGIALVVLFATGIAVGGLCATYFRLDFGLGAVEQKVSLHAAQLAPRALEPASPPATLAFNASTPGPTLPPPTPKVAFLFLSRGSLSNQQLWESWFTAQPDTLRDRASIYVHVPPFKIRDKHPDLSPLFKRAIIPSVTTEYYENLVHGMVQLLLIAAAEPRNTHFVFVSDSSIPVKPFGYVYDELVADAQSRFCIAPYTSATCLMGYKSDKKNIRPAEEHFMKAEMWSTLSRAHVTTLLRELPYVLRLTRDASLNIGRCGAPDEAIFPTIIHQFHGDTAFSTCHGPYDKRASFSTG